MISTKKLIKWLQRCPATSSVEIDEGGLALVVRYRDNLVYACYELGGEFVGNNSMLTKPGTVKRQAKMVDNVTSKTLRAEDYLKECGPNNPRSTIAWERRRVLEDDFPQHTLGNYTVKVSATNSSGQANLWEVLRDGKMISTSKKRKSHGLHRYTLHEAKSIAEHLWAKDRISEP